MHCWQPSHERTNERAEQLSTLAHYAYFSAVKSVEKREEAPVSTGNRVGEGGSGSQAAPPPSLVYLQALLHAASMDGVFRHIRLDKRLRHYI